MCVGVCRLDAPTWSPPRPPSVAAPMNPETKKLFYVWFLGARECRGLRGDEYVRPIVRWPFIANFYSISNPTSLALMGVVPWIRRPFDWIGGNRPGQLSATSFYFILFLPSFFRLNERRSRYRKPLRIPFDQVHRFRALLVKSRVLRRTQTCDRTVHYDTFRLPLQIGGKCYFNKFAHESW